MYIYVIYNIKQTKIQANKRKSSVRDCDISATHLTLTISYNYNIKLYIIYFLRILCCIF